MELGSFINVFTRARHWSVSWARWIQSIPSCPCLRFILKISSRIHVSSFPHQLTLNLYKVLSFCGRSLAFHATNLAITTQKLWTTWEVMCVVSGHSCPHRNLHSVWIPYWYFNMALFITAWLLFAGILVRASAKHFGESCRVWQGGRRVFIRMAAPIDTVMMKYRRQGPDEREDQGGWPRVPSISTHRVLLPQASLMWCGGEQYCWHSQLDCCSRAVLRLDGRKGRTAFHPSLFSVSYSCTCILLALFLSTLVSSAHDLIIAFFLLLLNVSLHTYLRFWYMF
jgi:hypothetical protein